jgi:hypothetical protein
MSIMVQGCSTLSTESPLEERIGSGESGSVSILTECRGLIRWVDMNHWCAASWRSWVWVNHRGRDSHPPPSFSAFVSIYTEWPETEQPPPNEGLMVPMVVAAATIWPLHVQNQGTMVRPRAA